MSCNQKTELHVVYDDCGGFFLKRCCFSKGKFISEEDFFKKSIRELATYEVNPFDIDDILQCNHDCDFKPYIDTLVLDAIRICNIQCYNCVVFTPQIKDFIKSHPESIKKRKDVFFKVIEHFKNSGIDKLIIDNTGEIFIYYDEIVDLLKSLDSTQFKQITFATNATLLNKERIDELYNISKQTNIKYIFVVSVDGTDKETFEAVRVGASFDTVMENIAILKYYFNIVCTYTIKKPNLKDIKNIDTFFKERGISNYRVQSDFFVPSFSKLLTDEQKCK